MFSAASFVKIFKLGIAWQFIYSRKLKISPITLDKDEIRQNIESQNNINLVLMANAVIISPRSWNGIPKRLAFLLDAHHPPCHIVVPVVYILHPTSISQIIVFLLQCKIFIQLSA